jgi:hypothetical protein
MSRREAAERARVRHGSKLMSENRCDLAAENGLAQKRTGRPQLRLVEAQDRPPAGEPASRPHSVEPEVPSEDDRLGPEAA